METKTTKSIHPLAAIAAISVTLFSLAGIGAIMGLIPTGQSQTAQVQALKPAEEPAKLAATGQPSQTTAVNTTTVTESRPADKPVAHKPAVKHAKPVERVAKPAEPPVTSVKSEAPIVVAQNNPPPAVMPPPPPPAVEPPRPICYDCGVIQSVRQVERKGEGSGLGAAVGGVAGGVLGHQTGGGRGKDVMTVLGALGGAVAGHQIEKNVKKVVSYEIAVRFDDGSNRVITQDAAPSWRPGDRVKVVNGVIAANP